MKNKRFSFLLLVCIPICLLAQQNPQPHFRNYSTEHGLPSPEVYVAFQDSKGYMWFGTDNGASRFDGYHFKNYGTKEGLTSNVVFDIFEDEEENIWFGTMTGDVFILKGDTIVPYRFNHLVQQYQGRFDEAHLTYITKGKRVYFELQKLGILYIDSLGQDSLFSSKRALSSLIIDIEGHSETLETDIRRDSSWIWDSYYVNNRVMEYELNSASGLKRLELASIFPAFYHFKSLRLSSGDLLIFGYHFLYCLDEGKILWSQPFSFPINKIIEDESGRIWICGNHGQGIRTYQGLAGLKDNTYSHFLQEFSVSDLFTDSKGGIWVTTLEKGVMYSPDWQLLNYDSRIGISDNVVTALTFKNEKELFLGCQNGDIFQLNYANNYLEATLVNPFGYHNFDLLYLSDIDALLSNGAYWKNGRWNFVTYENPKTKRINTFKPHKLDKLQIHSQTNLIGCNHQGFFFIDINKKKVSYKAHHNGITGRTFAVHTDQEGRLWVGKSYGIFKFAEDKLVGSNIKHPAFHTRVEDIDEFQDSSLVFGTKGWGVVIWKGKDFSIISEEEGLTTNMIEDVHVDENGILWVGTLNGLNKVAFDQKGKAIVRQFTMANGLPSNEIYKIKSYKDQVWLCTAGGLVKFHEQPKTIRADSPILQKIELNGEVLAATSPARFSYQENNFAFDFLTINYRQNGKINYRFRLNDEINWSYTENLSVNYPALSPGKYHFEVQAQNEDEFWSDSTKYSFEIRPPWWTTSWFIGLLGMTFISSGFGLFQYRIAQLKKENLIQQQMTELERSALQAQMNPHFIFNCLNSIQNFILQNDNQKAVEFLSRFARLVRLNLNASVEGNISLEEEVSLLENYLALEQERFDYQFEYHIELSEGLTNRDIELPPLLIQPFVENAIVHGLSQREGEGKGKVTINIQQEGNHLLVKVQDNGVGYVPKITTNTLPKHKSVGMSITQKRLNLLDSSLPETIKITSLTDDKCNQIGTEISILIKTKYHKPDEK